MSKKKQKKQDQGSERSLRNAGGTTPHYEKRMNRLLKRMRKARDENTLDLIYGQATLLIINLEAHKDDRRITESIWKKTDEKYIKIVELWEQKTDNEIEM